jgi:L,D-transpeptidase YbiS
MPRSILYRQPRRVVVLAAAILWISCVDGQSSSLIHSRSGLVEMLLEYLEVRYPHQAFNEHVLYISVSRQRLFHVVQRRLVAEYEVSTSRNGLGAEQDSHRTPTGLHRIHGKVGEGVPQFGVLRDREFTGVIADPDFAGQDKDWITTRILWLDGLEPGRNKGGAVDSRERFIYLHGTANERSIGSPTSMGCVRMRNADIVELFDAVPDGTMVVILDN